MAINDSLGLRSKRISPQSHKANRSAGGGAEKLQTELIKLKFEVPSRRRQGEKRKERKQRTENKEAETGSR